MEITWIDISQQSPGILGDCFQVKKKDGKEVAAAFFPNRLPWIVSLGMKPTQWIELDSGYPLYGVTHWLKK